MSVLGSKSFGIAEILAGGVDPDRVSTNFLGRRSFLVLLIIVQGLQSLCANHIASVWSSVHLHLLCGWGRPYLWTRYPDDLSSVIESELLRRRSTTRHDLSTYNKTELIMSQMQMCTIMRSPRCEPIRNLSLFSLSDIPMAGHNAFPR